MQAQELFIGVDVAKSTLVSCIHGTAGRSEIANDESAIVLWLADVPPQAAIAVESTGRYHRALVRLAHACGRTVFVLNARDVYFYSKVLGARAKTDRTDSQIIARYLAEHHAALKPWAPITPIHEQMHELLRCRDGATTKRMSLRQLVHGISSLDPAMKRLEHEFDALVHDIDAQIAALLKHDAQLDQASKLLRTITGFGPLGSVMFGSLFCTMNFANADAVVAYSGLDPRPNDSGAKTGRRRLSKKGNPQLRRQLYLAAFAASHSKALGPLYQAIKAKGFKSTEALVILGRKLVRVAWAVWKSGTAFDPTLLSTNSACAKT